MPASLNAMLTGGAFNALLHGSAPPVKRYFARVDEHLPTLSRDAQEAFLRLEQAKWEQRYADFRARINSGWDYRGEITAWDFVDTLNGLDKRIAECLRVAA